MREVAVFHCSCGNVDCIELQEMFDLGCTPEHTSVYCSRCKEPMTYQRTEVRSEKPGVVLPLVNQATNNTLANLSKLLMAEKAQRIRAEKALKSLAFLAGIYGIGGSTNEENEWIEWAYAQVDGEQ